MKNHFLIISLFTLAAGSTYAVEIPAPDAPKPAEQKIEDNAKPKAKDVPNAGKIAYLGVAGDPISNLLADHLQLKMGIALHSVMDKSPAHKGGLKQNDIITRFAGKEIKTQNDLRGSLHDKSPGDEVEATIIRKGKEIKKKFTLGERPTIMAMPPLMPQNARDLPPAQAEGMKNKLRKELQGLDLPEAQLELLLKQMGQAIPKELQNLPKGAMPLLRLNGKQFGSSSASMRDGEGSLTLKTGPNGKELTAKDTAGKLLFQGPMNDANDKAAIPEDILRRANKLDNGTMFKLEVK